MSAALDLQTVPRTRAEALQIFRACAREIWRNADAVPLSVSDEEPAPGAIASVGLRGTPRRLGTYVVNHDVPRTLRVAERALAYPDDVFRKLMMHEAVHLGIGPHGAEFRRVCLAHGGSLSGGEARGEPVLVQRKCGARYRTVQEFPREEGGVPAAKAWAHAHSSLDGFRYRIVY